jgi:hypothetical protein
VAGGSSCFAYSLAAFVTAASARWVGLGAGRALRWCHSQRAVVCFEGFCGERKYRWWLERWGGVAAAVGGLGHLLCSYLLRSVISLGTSRCQLTFISLIVQSPNRPHTHSCSYVATLFNASQILSLCHSPACDASDSRCFFWQLFSLIGGAPTSVHASSLPSFSTVQHVPA